MNPIAQISASAETQSDFEVATRLAIEIFGNCQGIQEECDPEVPDETYHVVDVVDAGEPSDVIDRELKWHRLIREQLPETKVDFRLAVYA